MMSGKVLVIGAGFLQAFVIRRACEMGLTVVAVDRDPRALGFEWAHKRVVVDIKDQGSCLEVAESESVDAVLSVCTDLAVKTVAFVAGSLGLPGLPAEAARTCTNKALMRETLARAHVGRVAFGKASSPEEAVRAASSIGFPCILKPVDSVGSRGVTKIDNVSLVVAGFEAAARASACGDVIVEEFIDGPEISVEAVTRGGETTIAAVTDKITSGPPHFVELGHTQPSVFSDERAVRETVQDCVRALGVDWSASHTELRLTEEGPRVMEVGARLGGDRITSDLVPLSTGIDLMEAVILTSFGRAPQMTPRYRKGSAIRYLRVPPGRITAIRGVESARSVAGVTDVHMDMSIGDTVPRLRSSLDRVGHVVAQGPSASEAASAAEEAVARIEVEVRQ
ncbi:MAG: ATP-grasp domain-containing protein [Candidatus Eisenbacteria bacterium]|nr:ATP-grasp domain-containing protein [Candidatus Eisenbacteria bacterium]